MKQGDKVITAQTSVLKEVVNFYQDLYSSKSVDADSLKNYFEKVQVPTLSDEDKNKCEGMLTVDECKFFFFLFGMAKNKSPGLDGLPFEFYQTFWSDIAVTFVNALNENFVKGIMTKSQKLGVLVLNHKKGDEENLANWRPITLLNYDYKIMATVTAHAQVPESNGHNYT